MPAVECPTALPFLIALFWLALTSLERVSQLTVVEIDAQVPSIWQRVQVD